MKTKKSNKLSGALLPEELSSIQAFCIYINAHDGWLENARTSTSATGVKWIHIEGGYKTNRKIDVCKSWITSRDEVTSELIEAIKFEIQGKQ